MDRIIGEVFFVFDVGVEGVEFDKLLVMLESGMSEFVDNVVKKFLWLFIKVGFK